MARILLVFALIGLIAPSVSGRCDDTEKADQCVTEQGGAPKNPEEGSEPTDEEICSYAKTFMQCVRDACGTTDVPIRYQTKIDEVKNGISDDSIECDLGHAVTHRLSYLAIVLVIFAFFVLV